MKVYKIHSGLFLQNMKKILQESGHEDWSYLERVRGKNRGATIGAFDSQLYKKRKRSFSDKLSLEARRRSESESSNFSVVPSVSSRGSESPNSESSDSGGTEYTAPKLKKKRVEAIPEELVLVSEKSQTSIRNITQMTSAILKSQGENLDDYNISSATTYRRLSSMRKKNGR